MGTALVTLKIMPESPETNLEEVENSVKEKIESQEGKEVAFKEEPVAFGLKAIITKFSLDEDKELEAIENLIKEIDGVNSVQVIDMRRAFG
jgi:elongation factor 1-beta